ncbi:hypothetical protein K474DRAFT_1676980 [Panus rudis PR-1116 ss-1]|nr:hypothetical protein K474DRAFT_1676980 [Panus rudis PR-1116 ss-1]
MPSSTVSSEPLSSPSPSPPPPDPPRSAPTATKPPSANGATATTTSGAGLGSDSELSELTEDEQENETRNMTSNEDAEEDDEERPRPARRGGRRRRGIVPVPMWGWAYPKSKKDELNNRAVEEEEEEEQSGPARAMEEEEDEDHDNGDHHSRDGDDEDPVPEEPQDAIPGPAAEEEDAAEEDIANNREADNEPDTAVKPPENNDDDTDEEMDVSDPEDEPEPPADEEQDEVQDPPPVPPPPRQQPSVAAEASPEPSDDENDDEEEVAAEEEQDPEPAAESEDEDEADVKASAAASAASATKVLTPANDDDPNTPTVAEPVVPPPVTLTPVVATGSSIMAGSEVFVPPPSSSSSSSNPTPRQSPSVSRTPTPEPPSEPEESKPASRRGRSGRGGLTSRRSRRKPKTELNPDNDADMDQNPLDADDRDAADMDDVDEDSPEMESDLLPVHRVEALDSLAQIELKFAQLRERIYVEKMEALAWEEALIHQGIHPEYIHLHDELSKRRDKRLQLASRRRDYEVSSATKRRKLDEDGVWSWWKNARDELQTEMIAETNGRRRRMEREKRALDRPQPGIFSMICFGFLVTHANLVRRIPGAPLHVPPPPSLHDIAKAFPFDSSTDPSQRKASKKRAAPSEPLVYPTLTTLSPAEIHDDLQFLLNSRQHAAMFDMARPGGFGHHPQVFDPFGLPPGPPHLGPPPHVMDGPMPGHMRIPPQMQGGPPPHMPPPGFGGNGPLPPQQGPRVQGKGVHHPQPMDIDMRPHSSLGHVQGYPMSTVPVNLLRRSISPVPVQAFNGSHGPGGPPPRPSSSAAAPNGAKAHGWIPGPGPSGEKDVPTKRMSMNGVQERDFRDVPMHERGGPLPPPHDGMPPNSKMRVAGEPRHSMTTEEADLDRDFDLYHNRSGHVPPPSSSRHQPVGASGQFDRERERAPPQHSHQHTHQHMHPHPHPPHSSGSSSSQAGPPPHIHAHPPHHPHHHHHHHHVHHHHHTPNGPGQGPNDRGLLPGSNGGMSPRTQRELESRRALSGPPTELVDLGSSGPRHVIPNPLPPQWRGDDQPPPPELRERERERERERGRGGLAPPERDRPLPFVMTPTQAMQVNNNTSGPGLPPPSPRSGPVPGSRGPSSRRGSWSSVIEDGPGRPSSSASLGPGAGRELPPPSGSGSNGHRHSLSGSGGQDRMGRSRDVISPSLQARSPSRGHANGVRLPPLSPPGNPSSSMPLRSPRPNTLLPPPPQTSGTSPSLKPHRGGSPPLGPPLTRSPLIRGDHGRDRDRDRDLGAPPINTRTTSPLAMFPPPSSSGPSLPPPTSVPIPTSRLPVVGGLTDRHLSPPSLSGATSPSKLTAPAAAVPIDGP